MRFRNWNRVGFKSSSSSREYHHHSSSLPAITPPLLGTTANFGKTPLTSGVIVSQSRISQLRITTPKQCLMLEALNLGPVRGRPSRRVVLYIGNQEVVPSTCVYSLFLLTRHAISEVHLTTEPRCSRTVLWFFPRMELVVWFSLIEGYDSDPDFNPGAYIPEASQPKKRERKKADDSSRSRSAGRTRRGETLSRIASRPSNAQGL